MTRPFTPDEDQLIRDLWGVSSVTAIADRMDRKPKVVRSRAKNILMLPSLTPGPRTRLSADQERRILLYRDQGMSLSAIAGSMGLSDTTVMYALRRMQSGDGSGALSDVSVLDTTRRRAPAAARVARPDWFQEDVSKLARSGR